MNKNLEPENPCNMDLLNGGGGAESTAIMGLRAHGLMDNVKSNCHSELVSESVPRYELPLTLIESASLGLRLALNAIARACGQKRGFARRALDSAQGKPCSVALLGLAFTMAEILLSLTIIGVVAAITLPSLTGNINERTWNTQRKALYARMSQAIALMPALNGYGTLIEETDSAGSTSITDTAAETFVTDGLAKVLKINNICDSEHLEDCGITQSITTLKGTSMSFPNTMQTFNSLMVGSYSTVYSARINLLDTKAAAFETANGESIAVFYNPQCETDMAETVMHYAQSKMCANFVYDLNGTKGPNTVGKDIGFITALYSTDPVIVAPMPLLQVASNSKQHLEASKTCTEFDKESRLPNRDELSALFYNKAFLGNMTGEDYYWSGSIVAKSDSNAAWAQYFNSGIRNTVSRNGGYMVHCIKR